MISGAFFALGSSLIIWVSRRSLLHPKAHGFFRFFVFEAVLALTILNGPHWFSDPLGARQLASWFLLSLSAVFVVWGFRLLQRLGGFRPSDEVSSRFGWEKTGSIVTTGIYRYIRHPMYSSLLLFTWGALTWSAWGVRGCSPCSSQPRPSMLLTQVCAEDVRSYSDEGTLGDPGPECLT